MFILTLAASLSFAAPPTLSAELGLPGVDESLTQDDAAWIAEQVHLDAMIVNGDPIESDAWPSAGGLIIGGTVQGYEVAMLVCTGSLIAPDVILTAAHCIDTDMILGQYGLDGSDLKEPFFGLAFDSDLKRYGLGVAKPLPDDAGVSTAEDGEPRWIYNDNWTNSLAAKKHGDIALVFLDEPLDGHPLAYLPTVEETEQIAKGDELYLVGYGLSDYASQSGSGVRRGGPGKIYNLEDYKVQVAGDPKETRVCSGDSGGPAYWRVDTDSSEEWRQIGVASYVTGYPDACTIGWSTLVTGYREWIEDEMTLRCEDGERAWCDIPGIIPPPLADGTLAWEIPVDTDGDGIPDDEEKKACACNSGSEASLPWLALLGVLIPLRRRFRRG
jgi:hypothetical protein